MGNGQAFSLTSLSLSLSLSLALDVGGWAKAGITATRLRAYHLGFRV